VSDRRRTEALVVAAGSILARHGTLLGQAPFRELFTAVSRVAPIARLSVALLEAPEHLRVYVAAGVESMLSPIGARRAGEGVAWRAAIDRGEIFRCDDTRSGGGHDPTFAAAGLLSYVVLPLGHVPGAGALGALFAFWPEAFAASLDAVPGLEAVAELVAGGLEREVRLARERRLAHILETSSDAMLAWDADGVVTDANAAALSLTGRTRRELVGARMDELVGHTPVPASTPAGARLELAARSGTVPVSATVTAVEGDPRVAAHALLRDVSDVVRAERESAESLQRVRELEEQHRALLDAAPLAIVRIDPATAGLDYLNRRGADLFGVRVADALATPSFLRARHVDPEGLEAYDAALARARRGAAAPPYEARIRGRGGEPVTCLVTLYPLRTERGRVLAIEGTVKDASGEHAARTRLVSSDRYATLGVLASGVAHEINNPAAFILLGLDMLDRLLRGPGVSLDEGSADSIRALGGELRDSIRRIVDITRDLRLFASSASGAEGKPTFVDVNRTVESALSLTRGKIVERAHVERDLGDVPPVLLPDGRLAQVVVNLLLNAAQATPKAAPGESHVITVATRSDGRVVEIEVRDTGAGIAPENLSRIWQPFFSTKPPESGTGLGLSICREIVERAGGVISAQSPPPGADRGARFLVVLPAAGVEPEPASVAAPSTSRAPDAGRVLLVDDEPALARVLALEISGVHEVVSTTSGAGALELVARERFDAVLCDLQMPGMSGEALWAEVRRRDPELADAFVFMTGVGFGADVERFLAASRRPVLEKPFATDEALALIGSIVRARRVATSP
jgi:PAS domain S-box-containing protein